MSELLGPDGKPARKSEFGFQPVAEMERSVPSRSRRRTAYFGYGEQPNVDAEVEACDVGDVRDR